VQSDQSGIANHVISVTESASKTSRPRVVPLAIHKRGWRRDLQLRSSKPRPFLFDVQADEGAIQL
ncbi:hypothetical protein, partial [Bradyrhizobium sp.]|uniref:hypothetical protein n=1 Tax=Bradyrhizobium sp. TaxID=376 RepID=UPI00391BB8F9